VVVKCAGSVQAEDDSSAAGRKAKLHALGVGKDVIQTTFQKYALGALSLRPRRKMPRSLAFQAELPVFDKLI
jgi:hypothetical protein